MATVSTLSCDHRSVCPYLSSFSAPSKIARRPSRVGPARTEIIGKTATKNHRTARPFCVCVARLVLKAAISRRPTISHSIAVWGHKRRSLVYGLASVRSAITGSVLTRPLVRVVGRATVFATTISRVTSRISNRSSGRHCPSWAVFTRQRVALCSRRADACSYGGREKRGSFSPVTTSVGLNRCPSGVTAMSVCWSVKEAVILAKMNWCWCYRVWCAGSIW